MSFYVEIMKSYVSLIKTYTISIGYFLRFNECKTNILNFALEIRFVIEFTITRYFIANARKEKFTIVFNMYINSESVRRSHVRYLSRTGYDVEVKNEMST